MLKTLQDGAQTRHSLEKWSQPVVFWQKGAAGDRLSAELAELHDALASRLAAGDRPTANGNLAPDLSTERFVGSSERPR